MIIKTSFNKKHVEYLKLMSIMFLIVLILFTSISSFTSSFAPTDYYSFSNAFNESKESLVDQRIIIGLKDNIGKKNADNSVQKKIGLRGAFTSYGVGLNKESSYFSVDSHLITPVESNLLSYIWTDKSEQNFLIQYVPIQRVVTDISFDDNSNNVYLSKTLYGLLNNPDEISIYSCVLNENIMFKVIGYYNNSESNRLQGVFYNVYQEPIFFNHTGFKALYGGKEDYFDNIQTDIIFSNNSEYNDIVYNIFSEKHWKESFVKYDLFSSVYSRMDQLNNRKTFYSLMLGIFMLGVFIYLIIILFSYYKESFIASIIFCNPYILLILWGGSIFAVYGLSKLLNSHLLFFEPAVGISLSIVVVLVLVQMLIHYFLKNKKGIAKI